MFRGVVSVGLFNLDPVLAKILIKEMENSAQLAYCGTDYFEGGLCYIVYGKKQFSVIKSSFEVLERKNSQILKRIKSYKYLFIHIDMD